MMRAWVRRYGDWKPGWLIGASGTDRVLIAYDDKSSSPGLALARVHSEDCRPMRTKIDFLPDAADAAKQK